MIDLKHGYDMSDLQLEIANEIAITEFDKPVYRRVSAKNIIKLVNIITKEAVTNVE